MINFKRNSLTLIAIIAFATFFCGASPVMAQVSLGAAQSFGVLAGSAVTNTGPTVVLGDVGVSPGSAISGFPPGTVVGGALHSNDALAIQAQMDLTVAYNAVAGMTCNTNLSGQDLGGMTLMPGVYCFNTSAQLTGILTLDAQNNPNAIFIFQIGTTLTTASNAAVNVINGGSRFNVYWQVGSSATIGTGTAFSGHILALTSITVTTGASVTGSLLARNGAVTLDSNLITSAFVVCTPPPTNLVSWWPGNGNANDIRGTNNGTLVNGTTFATGKVGQAFSFDGVDDFVDVPNNANLEPQALTVDFWFNSASPGTNAYLLSKGAATCQFGSYSFNNAGTGGGLAFDVTINGSLIRSPISSPTVFDGMWHLAAGTYNGKTVRLFIDGVEVGTGTLAPGSITYGLATTNNLTFGRYNGTCILSYAGLLDEIEIFNRALSLTEIQTIFDAGSTGKCDCPSTTCPANITQSNDLNQCGALVTYPAPTPGGTRCGTLSCSPASGSFFPVGTTTVTCTASTTGASCTFTVTVNDTQPPTITCPANITAVTSICAGSSQVVTYPPPTASDNCPGVTVACVPPSGSTIPIGTSTVTCTATDASGNTATCSFTVSLFNACLQDDNNPNIVLLWNTVTGAYRFCCNGTIYTGTGSVLNKGISHSINHYAADRRVNGVLDCALTRGQAGLQSPAGVLICAINDRDVRNNSCNCGGAPPAPATIK